MEVPDRKASQLHVFGANKATLLDKKKIQEPSSFRACFYQVLPTGGGLTVLLTLWLGDKKGNEFTEADSPVCVNDLEQEMHVEHSRMPSNDQAKVWIAGSAATRCSCPSRSRMDHVNDILRAVEVEWRRMAC